eukprot:8073007-Lingulodinium_polyedra.AAC.1
MPLLTHCWSSVNTGSCICRCSEASTTSATVSHGGAAAGARGWAPACSCWLSAGSRRMSMWTACGWPAEG